MDLTNPGFRKSIIAEIESPENKARKAEHEKRFQVYNDHQRNYVLEMLQNEFSPQTVREMRTCTSVNLTRRIVDEMASIYKRKPERDLSEMTEDQELGVELLYQAAKVDTYLKRANQKFKLHDQCALQVIPKGGKLCVRLLAPHQYDVIPMSDDPEAPFAYVVSSYDKTMLQSANEGVTDIQGNYYGSKNQPQEGKGSKQIAEEQNAKPPRRYVVWTAEMNMVMNENGDIIEAAPNPIERLPFIDVSDEKDFQFWIERGSGIVEFNLDFSVVLSDTCNTNRLQSYSQPVIVAESLPQSVTVGPQHILFLPLDPTRPDVKPSFEFANPNPDMKASLELQDKLISYFLTSRGISPKTISGNAEGDKFTSGVERLLAMIERFEASQGDVDVFTEIEDRLYELFRAWYSVTVGTSMLDEKYNFGTWPEESEVTVKFMGPEVVQTESDKEDSVIKRLDAGLISKVEAVMEIRNCDEETASKIVAEMDAPETGALNKFDQVQNTEA